MTRYAHNFEDSVQKKSLKKDNLSLKNVTNSFLYFVWTNWIYTKFYNEKETVTWIKRKEGLLNESIMSQWSLAAENNSLLTKKSVIGLTYEYFDDTPAVVWHFDVSWLHIFQHPKDTCYNNKCCLPTLGLPIKHNIPIYTADFH